MQSLTSAQLTYLQRGGLIGYDITVTPVTGTGYTITEADILDGTFVLDRSNWTSSQAVEIGNADAAELTFVLDNSDGRWNIKTLEGATLVLSFDIGGVALAGGKFTVDMQTKLQQTVSVSALDYMAKFNKLYDGALTYPATLLQIVQDACTDCGVTLHSTSFTNAAYSVTEEPIDPDITYHVLIAWVSQLAGSNAWIDEDGELRITWYGEANTVEGFTIDASMEYADVKHGETELNITGVQYRVEDITYLAGTTTYCFTFADNPLFQSDYASMLSTILTKISAQKFLPYESLPTVCLPNIWPGDVVIADAVSFTPADDGAELAATTSNADIAAITNAAGIDGAGLTAKTYFKAAVMIGKHTISLKSEMLGVGETAKVISYANGTSFTSAQSNAVKAIATNKVETLAIERTLTVGASTVVVRIDDTSGISIAKDGTKVFGVDTDGNMYAARIAATADPEKYYGIIGDFPGVGIGLALYNTDMTTDPFMFISVLEGATPVDYGGFSLNDTNGTQRIYADSDGWFFVKDESGETRISSFTDGTFQIPNSGDTKSVLNITPTYAQLNYPGATNHGIGVDSTGPYKVVSGTKTYL